MQSAISINGRFLSQPMVGVQRFAMEVVKAIDALIDSGEYAALAGRVEILAPSAAREFPLRHIPVRRCGFGSGYFWEQFEFPLHAHGRLLLNLCMLGPVVMHRQIVVVHDATARALPTNFTALFRAAYGFLIPRLCRRAFRAVTVSEFSRREIGKWYGVDVSNMPVCYEGGDHVAAVPPDYGVIDRLGLANRKLFLGVGMSNNKNAETAIAAFHKAALPDTVMVLTGMRTFMVNGRRPDIAMPGVVNAGYVSDAELHALYDRALALVCPSRYEGFGLTPVEAMACGCPAIISTQAAMVEICGDAALQCGPDDVDGFAGLMRLVHDDPARRAQMIAAGHARVARFTWDSTARILLDLCLQALTTQGQVLPSAAVAHQAG
jgi:glycosyltransferase involved in cell wall biosynthesis